VTAAAFQQRGASLGPGANVAGPGDLASIDAEIDELGIVDRGGSCATAEVDQATSLRRMFLHEIEAGPAPAARSSPRPRFVSPLPPADRLAILQNARRAKVVAIASGKGGVGKTNIAVNTAIMLARRGLRVTLLDADLGTANADVLCGVMPAARIDHVLAPGGLVHQDGGARRLADIAIDAPGGFKLVPGSAGIGRMADLTSGERRWLVSALVELAADTDVVLIDAAAGVGQGVTSLLQAADLAIVVTTPEPTAIADAYALIKCLVMEAADDDPADGSDRIALVVNQAREPVEAFATHARMAAVCDRFLGLALPMLGFVAQDVRVGEAVRAQKPFAIAHPGAPASRNVSDLADAIVDLLGVKPVSEGLSTGTSTSASADRGIGALVRRLLGFSSKSDHAAEKS
jgi:flagellar biosynthesis protein FlhG